MIKNKYMSVLCLTVHRLCITLPSRRVWPLQEKRGSCSRAVPRLPSRELRAPLDGTCHGSRGKAVTVRLYLVFTQHRVAPVAIRL